MQYLPVNCFAGNTAVSAVGLHVILLYRHFFRIFNIRGKHASCKNFSKQYKQVANLHRLSESGEVVAMIVVAVQCCGISRLPAENHG